MRKKLVLSLLIVFLSNYIPLVYAESLSKYAYQNKDYGFSIKPPVGWDAQEDPGLGAAVVFYSDKPDYQGANSFYANINIHVSNPTQADAHDILASIDEMFAQYFNDIVVHKKIIERVNGHETVIYSCSYTQGAYRLRADGMTMLCKKGTFMAVATSLEKNWENYKSIFYKSLRTLTCDNKE